MTGDSRERLYHLAVARDWDAARREGAYRVSTLGASLDEVGFLHASFADQLAGTAERFYRQVDEPLVVLVIDPGRVDADVVVEPVASGELFPHIYGPLPVEAVIEVRPARMVDGRLETLGP